HLHRTLPVTQVEEHHTAVVAGSGHPPRQDDLLPGVFGPEVPAHVGPPSGQCGHRASPCVRTHFTTSSSPNSSWWPSESRRRVAVPAATSRSPRITANRAPLRSAAFIWCPR